ncbi:hypothetical protein IFT98_02295 [Pseudomonas sp. CFBP 8770]|uniref:hypothetical protein n=1 Tax=unclassified Pseudomonas TaxID=196821 RepID=UPI00177D2913|nr:MULTISPECIES: hypothetical protein [unclassified Pseudomonas]MBD8473087.1 hypothetical protein [Pseudomonas sp. CFBP 8773]MBD8645810.1 hypothetical protein [Pseudomonas sp. CFBP 8770]
MSMQAEIARLTGRLIFDVDNRGLIRFQRGLEQAQQKMQQIGQTYTAMAAQLSKNLKLTIDTSAIDKAKKKLDQALNRERRSEVALTNQKRLTFSAELAQQKLKYTGAMEQAGLVSALVRSQQEGAVIAAKAFAAQTKANGITKQQLASQDALTASKAKQARLEAILVKTRATSQKADDAHLLSMTKTQRIQEVMNRAASKAATDQIKHDARVQSQKRAEARKTIVQERQDQRWAWSQQRQSQWEANRNAPKPSGGIGIGGGMIALSGLGAAIAGLTAAVGLIGDRIQKRQDDASEAEQYTSLFKQAGGASQLNADRLRTGYENSSKTNGTIVDLESAKMFRTFALSEQQRGTSIDDILKKYETQQQAYRIAGLTTEEIKRSNIQQQQIRGKGYADTEDLNTLTEANPLLRPYMMKAWAEATKYKNAGDPKKLEAAFMQALPKRGLTRDILDRGQQLLVQDNKPTLERQQQSIQANQARNDSEAYLTKNRINTDPELVDAVKDNIEAHRQLAKAMEPVNAALRTFDTVLTKLSAGMLGKFFGMDSDGKRLSPERQAEAGATAGGAEGIGINPAALNGTMSPPSQQQILAAQANDPTNRLANWLGIGTQAQVPKEYGLGAPTSESDAKPNPFAINLEGLDGMKDGFNRYSAQAASATASNTSTKPSIAPAIQSTTNITVEPSTVHIELKGEGSAVDRQQVLDSFQAQLQQRNEELPQLIKKAVGQEFGSIISEARSMTKEIRR